MTDDFDDIRKKYESKLKSTLGSDDPTSKSKSSDGSSKDSYQKTFVSSDFDSFKKNSRPKVMSWYEKACNFSEKALKMDPDKAKLEELTEAIKICHLQITPAGATSFSLLAPISVALIIIIFSYRIIIYSFYFTNRIKIYCIITFFNNKFIEI